MESYQLGGRRGKTGGKVQGIRSINGSYKIDRRRLRIVWEMEKPKNLCTCLLYTSDAADDPRVV